MTPDTLNGIRSTILEGYALSTKQAVDLLGAYEEALVALKDITDRFESCLVLSGSDPHYAAIGVAQFRAVISQAEGTP